MILSDISIHRPVLATVMSLMIVLIGMMSFERLSVREYPNIDPPIVSIRTSYTGASAEIIESQITQPLEDALAGIEGIKTIKSSSSEQSSRITIEFVVERDMENAANDVRDKVSRARSRLPDEANDPVISKVDADDNAIIWLAFSSSQHNALEITDYADRYVVPRLQNLSGVASIRIGGERRYAMRIWLDRDRLAAYHLTPKDIEDALRNQNVEIPSGRIESVKREFTVLTVTDLQRPEEFNDLIIKTVNGYPIRLRDVGYSEIGAENERRVVRANGNEAVGLGIIKQSTANTLSVARAVHAEVPKISLPEGMTLKTAFDSAIFVEKSIEAVYKTMAEAFVLVVLVIFIFLRSFRVTLIPFVTIPVSIIGAFIFMRLFDFSLNILTLLGLVLAIGIVVDDAIVMLENIHRYIEKGLSPHEAALQGSREIAFAVIAMTITLAAVFVPLVFMTGNVGRLFVEFALTVSAAVVVSGFVALTLTPMMCMKILRSSEKQGFFYHFTEKIFESMNNVYRALLKITLKIRWIIILVFIATVAGAGLLILPSNQLPNFVISTMDENTSFPLIKSEIAPTEDRGSIISFVKAPEGATLEYTDKYMVEIEEFFKVIPEIKDYFVLIRDVNSGLAFTSLIPWKERTISQQEIVQSLMPKFMELSGVSAFAINRAPLGQRSRSRPVEFVIQGNTYEELQLASDKMLKKMAEYQGVNNMDSDLELNKPQLAVTINRDKVADVGVEVDEIGKTLETLLGGRQVTRFKWDGKQYDVIIKLADKDRTQPSDLTAIFVRGKSDNLVQLSNLATVTETVAPKTLERYNRARSTTITANITEGYSMGEALDFVEKTAKETLGKNMQTLWAGSSREFKEGSQALLMSFILALVFIYLVLSAQFESFITPFVIMLTVPLAMTGALITLYYSGGTLNVYSQIGLVMLIGLISRHGILIVEFANQLQAKGMALRDAVVESATLRLRPILMTSLSMILGTLPLAIATGAGAESRQQIGWVIVGGLLFGTLLTLFIIPTMYTFFVRQTKLS